MVIRTQFNADSFLANYIGFFCCFFCLFFISRQGVVSAKLTIDPVENSTNYYDVTVTVKSNVAKCIVVSEDLGVMVSGEREEKYPHK